MSSLSSSARVLAAFYTVARLSRQQPPQEGQPPMHPRPEAADWALSVALKTALLRAIGVPALRAMHSGRLYAQVYAPGRGLWQVSLAPWRIVSHNPGTRPAARSGSKGCRRYTG